MRPTTRITKTGEHEMNRNLQRKLKLAQAIRDSDRRKKIVQEAEPEILGVLRAWKLGLPIPDNQVQDMRQSLEKFSLTLLKEWQLDRELLPYHQQKRILLNHSKQILEATITVNRTILAQVEVINKANRVLPIVMKQLLDAAKKLESRIDSQPSAEVKKSGWHTIRIRGAAS
jgi:hypothetical protein